ncbi:hypothetical protein EAI_15326, partial [Harpegnathos saltator]
FYFHLKKSAAESLRLLSEVYGGFMGDRSQVTYFFSAFNMSGFVPTKRNLREAFISTLFYFHLKKSAAESLRLLSEVYWGFMGDRSQVVSEYWFRRFKSGD